MNRSRCGLLLLVAVMIGGSLAAGVDASPQNGPKIYISADLEGVTGAVTGEQLGPGGFEYERFRRFMTEEVLAAIEGARAAGAGEILVSDSHGNGQNLVLEMLPDDIKIVRSWPRDLTMMAGLDESFDGAIFIGYHAGTTNPEGVRAHTMSSATLTDIRINDHSSNETVWNAAVAGALGVPVIAISGDDATIAEARASLGAGFEEAVVKWAHSFHSATTLTPAAGQRVIRDAAERAVRNLGRAQPYVVSSPVRVTVRFKHYQPSQLLAYLPWFDRIDAHAVEYDAADMIEAASILVFLRSYRADIAP
ncbi:MAG: aminopeptidase [Acidobacteria bacterium]|nr:aminopeptidase [Acidobacteriota bacterium]